MDAIVRVVGGSGAFLRFLAAIDESLEIRRYGSAEDAIEEGACRALLLLPDYDAGADSVPQMPLEALEKLAALKRQGQRVYAENYVSYNHYQAAIFGCEIVGGSCHIAYEALAGCGTLTHRLGGERVLQAAGAIYHPAVVKLIDDVLPKGEVLMKRGRFVGTTQVASEPEDAQPVLIQTGGVITAQISITRFDPVNMLPNARWKRLFATLFGQVLDVAPARVASAFERLYPPIQTRMPLDTAIPPAERRSLMERAVRDAVAWHFDSGIIRGEHGEQGAVEMIMSSNQDLYANRRVDAGLYTGWLLTAAGQYFGQARWRRTGRNVFDYFASRAQIQSGEQGGMFTWYYNQDAGPHVFFSIDSGRCGIALCNMYALTGEASYLARIEALADGFLRWINDDLLFSNVFTHDMPVSDRTYAAGASLGSARTASVYAEMASFLTMAWRLTGRDAYRDRMARITDRLVRDYPDYDYYGHTTSSRNARLLMALTATHLTGARDYTAMINHLIDYLASIQLPCGGIYSEDNLSFASFGKKVNAIGENGITTPWDSDKISDQLYCVNNAVAALSLLKKLPAGSGIDREGGLAVLDGLLDYVLKIQIVSDDPRFAGGWMRAYDMTLGEYYGLDLDMFWGPKCIMAGWTMGILPLGLLSELTGDCAYA